MRTATLFKVNQLINFVKANSGQVTTEDVMNHLGTSYMTTLNYRNMANDILYKQGLTIPKIRRGNGWVWLVTNIWPSEIREATLEICKYMATNHRTALRHIQVAYNAPTFNRRSAEGMTVKHLMHDLEAGAVAAEDAKEKLESLIP
jgi:hypothetical protein